MLARIIFLIAIATAILVVLLLTLFSPLPENDPSDSLISFSLYVQQPHIPSSSSSFHTSHHRPHHKPTTVSSHVGGALIFHRTLTEGPEHTSRVVGKAQGFIIPHEDFANSDFNMIYLTFETLDYKGSVSVRARDMEHKHEEVLEVLGGTGAFAFARGIAVFQVMGNEDSVTTYRVKLMLRFPDRSDSIPP